MSGDFFYLYKLRMGRKPAVDTTVRLQTLIDACEMAFKDNNSFIQIDRNKPIGGQASDLKNGIYIADFKQDAGIISMLLVRGNPEMRVPGMLNIKTRSIRSFSSNNNDDVPAVSCHVVISTKEIPSGSSQGKYKMAMEVTRGIGRTLLKDFLSILMEEYAAKNPDLFITQKKKKNKKAPKEEVSYLPTVSFDPQDNGRLAEDLKSGLIDGFKLTRGIRDFTGEASEPSFKNVDVSLAAKIIPTKDYGKAMAAISNVSEEFGLKFANYKLELIDQNGTELESPRAAKLNNSSDGDLAYCKKIPIKGVSSNLEELYDQFHIPILDFGIKCIHNANNWI